MEGLCDNCNFISSAAKYLTSKQLSKLGLKCVYIKFLKGDIIFKEGTFSSNIIFVKKGLFKIHITGPKEEQLIKIVKPPSYLGIPTTINEKVNHYSATALEPTFACFIEIEVFKSLIYANREFAYEIMIQLCMNEVNSFRRCVNRTQKNIKGLIAESLLFLYNEIYDRNIFELPLTRAEFGSFVDSSRESVSRIFAEFTRNGLIEIKHRKIEILNEKLLNEISMKE